MIANHKDFIYKQYRDGFSAVYIVAGHQPICYAVSGNTEKRARELLAHILVQANFKII